jgi:hypothetical protein
MCENEGGERKEKKTKEQKIISIRLKVCLPQVSPNDGRVAKTILEPHWKPPFSCCKTSHVLSEDGKSNP